MFDEPDERIASAEDVKRQNMLRARSCIDELADLGACDALWELWDHLMDRIIVSERPSVRIDVQ